MFVQELNSLPGPTFQPYERKEAMSSKKKQHKEPRWIMSTKALPQLRKKTTYVLDGKDTITLQKRWREVIEAMRIGPIFCASPVRLSDAVCVLRRDYGVPIETKATVEGRKFYELNCDVREVAA